MSGGRGVHTVAEVLQLALILGDELVKIECCLVPELFLDVSSKLVRRRSRSAHP